MPLIDLSLPTTTRDERVCALIVTYNRLPLLREALASVRRQSRPPELIIVVDNGSTDGTAEWLAGEADSSVHVITQANLGGAGGFYTGLRAGYEAGADWVWCMDDDTIPDPDCLAKLVEAERRFTGGSPATRLGWLGSVVRWTDGSLHRMNEPKVDSFMEWGAQVLQTNFLPARWCSFVSVAISRQAIEACGLPLKDMFIWYDDVEYTARITTAGFSGIVALESRVEHRTQANYAPDVEDLAPANLWRFRYAFRNEVIVLRTRFGQQRSTLCFQFAKMMLRRTWLMLRARKFGYLLTAWWQGIRGLSFPMSVEWPSGQGRSICGPATEEPGPASRVNTSPLASS